MYTIDKGAMIHLVSPRMDSCQTITFIPSELFERAITTSIRASEERTTQFIYTTIRNLAATWNWGAYHADRLATFCWLYFYDTDQEKPAS